VRIAVVLGVIGVIGAVVAVGAFGRAAIAVPARHGPAASDAVSSFAREPVSRLAHRARCPARSTPAVVRGRFVCLGPGGSCRSRNQRAYRRYGFVCRNGQLAYDWARLARPLHIPTLAPGSACPATQPSGTLGQRGNTDAREAPAFGPGPAYVTLGAEATSGARLTFVWPPTEPPYIGWWGTKALWTIPRYTGVALIRGRQLDGTGGLGFDKGPGWTNRVHNALRLEGPETVLHPAATFVRGPGCYAYQVDTLRTSYLIVFSAVLR
jgi:hypothetical protein